jgi:UDP-glucose 4-epimerase
MATCLITGGAGFIGSHMTDLMLSQGHTVRVIDDFSVGTEKNLEHVLHSPELEIINKDITTINVDEPSFNGVDKVFHFAGIGDIVPSINSPTRYCEVNVMGTINVVEASRHAGVSSFTYAASSSCYGLADTPTDEKAKIDIQHPYALSKYMGELSVLNWGQFYNQRVNSVRIFNAYGLRSKTSGAYGAVMGVFLRQKIANKPLTIVGDGSQTRDFVNVKDLVKAFAAVGDLETSGEVFNVGAGNPVSVNSLAKLLDHECVNIPWRPGEPDCTWADISKIQEFTGWKPQISFADGVKEMIDNIEYWSSAPLWDVDSIAEATKEWNRFLG